MNFYKIKNNDKGDKYNIGLTSKTIYIYDVEGNEILTKPPKIIVLEDLHAKEMASKENRKNKDCKEKLAFKNITEASMRKIRTMLINRINKIEEKKMYKFYTSF